MPIEHINKTDTLNEGREKLNAAIDGANAADVTSKAADTKATQALANSESTQTQLDTIVIDGDSSVEAAQARVDEKGDPHPTLKARIDDGMNSVNTQLAETADDLEGRSINIKYPPAPFVGAKVDGVTDDTVQIRAIVQYAEQNNASVLIPGISVISGEIEIKKRLVLHGIGSGSGYADKALTEYQQISGFLVKGSGQKRVRTRVNHRSSVSDPQDDPISVALNIQAENVVLRDFTIFLDFDKTDNSPTNYGANWDVGIFIGCRVHNTFSNVHVLGYWREASVYLDVTRSSYTPEFVDLSGIPYDAGTVRNGADGLTLESIFTQGGKWGLKIQGAKPQVGKSGYSDDYYDELAGGLVTDRRGNFGASDVTAIACSFYGTNHHSKYRRDDTTGNYLTDTGGGSLSIDGLAGNASGMIQGMRFISCRFSTWEPFRIKLDRVNRPVFIGCHSEGGSGGLSTNGEPINYDDSDYYGPISTTQFTQNLVLISFNSTLRTSFIGSVDYTNLAPSSANKNNFSKGATFHGDTDILGSLGISGSISNVSGQLDLRSAPNTNVRLRQGATTVFLIDDQHISLYKIVRPDIDQTRSLGTSSRRWMEVHASNGMIVNTPDGTKRYRIRVDNAGQLITQLVT